jgi:hypothetical protein
MPAVRADETRAIEVGSRTLHLAPTRDGGFCFGFLGRFGTCALDRKRPIGVAFIASDPVELGGHVLAEPGAKLELTRADGSRQQIEVTWVSEPIDAGLFYTEVAREPRILALELRSAAGTVLGRHTRFEPLYDRRENPSEIDATGIPQGAVAEEKRRLLESGDAALWVAPQRGGGSCWWFTFRARTYGSNCPPPEFEARHRPLPIEAGINIERIYNGRVGPGVATVELRFDDGSVETVRSREGFVLYEFGTHRHPVVAIARDEFGAELGRHRYRPPRG